MIDWKNELSGFSFVEQFDEELVNKLFSLAVISDEQEGKVLTRQFEQSHSFYFLLKGNVKFSISVDGSQEEFNVGESNEVLTPVGWSGFRAPNRYATNVVCGSESRVIRWLHKDLNAFFEEHSTLGHAFIFFVLEKSVLLLNHVRTALIKYNNTEWDIDLGQDVDGQEEPENIPVPEPLVLLRKSPFFEIFSEHILNELAELAEKRWYLSGDRIFTQGERADGFDLLGHGKVALSYIDDPQNKLEESEFLRVIHRPGYVVGWAGADDIMHNDVTAIATKNTVVYHFKREDLHRIFTRKSVNTIKFAKRLLWLVSNHLRAARARLISERYELEILAVQNLIEQNATQLSVNSPLHKVPLLLRSALTLGDAFQLLFKLEQEGNTLEQSLSRLSLDILGRVFKEHEFFEGLKGVYEAVVEAPKEMPPAEVRVLTANKFIEVFEKVPFVIKGWENLPDSKGNIFIFNHLLNHPYNTLPNNFQLTLDSHFVSAMILHRKYGDPGIRVVRVPRAEEYGHQDYYGRLGHINVYTSESDKLEETKEMRFERRQRFYTTAGDYIKKQNNLILSPEGMSFETEDSPGLFKAGAFRLAASIDPEPLIVPMAVANFDKRLNRSVFALVIKEPFKISDLVENPEHNKEGLFKFLNDYKQQYRGYVEEAIALSQSVAKQKLNLKGFEKVENGVLVE